MKFKTQNGNMRRDFSEEEILKILEYTSFLPNYSILRERIYCILNEITEVQKCPECGREVSFLRENRYASYCSGICRSNSHLTKEKLKKTNIERYGVENPAQAREVKEKSRETCLKKYGVEFTFQSSEVKNKIKETNLERYGVENPAKNFDIKQTSKNTCLKKYGVEFTFQSKEIQERIRQTCLERYGVENPSYSKEIKDKISISKSNSFQARRNSEGTDYSGVVYILHFPELKVVKVGLTSNFRKRSISLEKDFGSFSIIELIETEKCFQLETELHQKFSDFRICLNEGNGRTEFFKDEILKFFVL